MKILQVITLSELGGAQSVVINLANSLCKEHEVIVAAGEGDGQMWNMLDKKVIKHQCLHLQRAISIVEELKALIELRKLYKKYNPDIIHLHSSKAGLLGRLVFPTKKIVYTVHGFDSIRLAHRKFLPIEKIMQHFCHSIIGVSQYDYHNMIAEGVTNNVSYVYNAITPPEIINIKPEVFNKHSKTVLAIARVSPQKKHDMFIEISKRLPQYGFIWIGNQEPIEGLPENCHFIGNIPNAGAYCRFADVFCLPSNYEGLPMVILEAMSLGKPVVSSDVGGIKEIVINDYNGYVLDNDVEKFVTAISEILSDDHRVSMMGNNSKALFEKSLTIDKMVDGYMEHYKTIKQSLA